MDLTRSPETRRQAIARLGTALAAGLAAPHLSAAGQAPRFRIAQIGKEHPHAHGKMEAIQRLPDLFEVVAWADTDAESQIAAVLDDPSVDVVVVETPPEVATETALRAIRAGKHVHLDKPGGFDHPAFAAMRTEAESAGRLVQMGYMLRENPAIALLFKAAAQGWLGTILEVDARMGKLADAGLRQELADYPGHGMFELGCHLVDCVVTLLGAPDEVVAMGTATGAPDDRLADNQLAALRCGSALATLRCNHADPAGFPRRMIAVAGTGGRATVAPLESGKIVLELENAHGGFAAGRHVVELPNPDGRYGGEFRTLARCLRDEKPYPWNAAHDIAVHATALRAAGLAPD